MTAKVSVALIGAGNSGRFYHLPHLLDSERFDLRTVVAAHEESAARAALPAGAEPCTDWRAAVARPDVELVVIALPHSLHHPVALEALRLGKHVLLEKPMTLTTTEADELIAAADASGAVLMVHQQRRWEADFAAILELVRSGELGDVWHIAVARSHQGRYRTASAERPHNGDRLAAWAHESDWGGGIAQVVGPHPVDHLLTLAGSAVTDVTARTHYQPGDEVEDWIGIDVDFASGATGRVDVFRWSGVAPPRFAVYGSAGTAVSATSEQVTVALCDGTTRRIEGLEPPGVLGAEVYTDLFDAIRHGRTPRVTAQQARDVVDVLERAHASAARASVSADNLIPGRKSG